MSQHTSQRPAVHARGQALSCAARLNTPRALGTPVHLLRVLVGTGPLLTPLLLPGSLGHLLGSERFHVPLLCGHPSRQQYWAEDYWVLVRCS